MRIRIRLPGRMHLALMFNFNIYTEMKKVKSIIILLCALFMCTACDDFLTTPPLDQITEDDWWKNEDQVRMMVDESYNKLYNSSGDNMIVFRDTYTDNAIWSGNTAVADGSFTAYSSNVKNEWKYADIANLNYILEGLERSKEIISADAYARLSAEVRFIRAYLYYEMLFYFGDIPLITKVLTTDESRQTSRQPRAEVLDFILTELNAVLVDIVKESSSETGRVNEDAVHAFLARIYLHEKDYDRVLLHTKAVMDAGKYGLYRAYDDSPETNSYEELFRPNADGNNNEVIFEKQYLAPLKAHSLNRKLSFPSSVYKGWKGFMPVQDLVDEYECLGGHSVKDCEVLGCEYAAKRAEITANGGYGEYEFRDPRLKSTIVTPGWEWKTGGVVTAVYGIEDPNSKDHISKETNSTGFLVTKWVDLDGEEADRTNGDKNITIFRYADILLMRAEALIEKNTDLQEAVAILNEIRDRARMPQNIVLASQSVLREQLRHERRVETAIEGLRYYDIVRWGICDKVKNGDVYGFAKMTDSGKRENIFMEKRVWKDHMYLWPIPQDARDLNENLTQNPGW